MFSQVGLLQSMWFLRVASFQHVRFSHFGLLRKVVFACCIVSKCEVFVRISHVSLLRNVAFACCIMSKWKVFAFGVVAKGGKCEVLAFWVVAKKKTWFQVLSRFKM